MPRTPSALAFGDVSADRYDANENDVREEFAGGHGTAVAAYTAATGRGTNLRVFLGAAVGADPDHPGEPDEGAQRAREALHELDVITYFNVVNGEHTGHVDVDSTTTRGDNAWEPGANGELDEAHVDSVFERWAQQGVELSCVLSQQQVTSRYAQERIIEQAAQRGVPMIGSGVQWGGSHHAIGPRYYEDLSLQIVSVEEATRLLDKRLAVDSDPIAVGKALLQNFKVPAVVVRRVDGTCGLVTRADGGRDLLLEPVPVVGHELDDFGPGDAIAGTIGAHMALIDAPREFPWPDMVMGLRLGMVAAARASEGRGALAGTPGLSYTYLQRTANAHFGTDIGTRGLT